MADYYPEHEAAGSGSSPAGGYGPPASDLPGLPGEDSAADPYGGPDDYDTAEDFGYGPGGSFGYGPGGDFGYGPAGDFGHPAGDFGHDAAGRSGVPAGSAGPPGQFGAVVPGPVPVDPALMSPAPAAPAGLGPAPAQPARPSPVPGSPGPLVPGRHKAPPGGWRRVIFGVTGGLVRTPEPAAQRRRRELTARARAPVTGGHHRVAVLSLKGGVGKTTITIGLGCTLAGLRPDRVIALDANPDRGTLADRLRLETAATVRDLLNERQQIRSYTDVRAYTTQVPSRLEVLGSDRDPAAAAPFSDADYRDVAAVLEQHYAVCLTDCGTGLRHSALTGVLRLADQIIVVSAPSVDGARSASAALDWLLAQGRGGLARNAVVVLAMASPRGRRGVDPGRLEQQFAARCRCVVTVPYDAHLAEGAELRPGRLRRATADAFLALAAEVGDGFARGPRGPRGPR